MENTLKDMFCVKEQKVTSHKGSVDHNGEFLFECQTDGCDRFVKFPADTDPAAFEETLVKHEAANAGQISLEGQEIKLAELIAGGNAEEVQPAQE